MGTHRMRDLLAWERRVIARLDSLLSSVDNRLERVEKALVLVGRVHCEGESTAGKSPKNVGVRNDGR